MKRYSGPERRRHKRVRVSLTVVYHKNEPLEVRIKTADQETLASMMDVSEGGMAIATNINIPVSTVLSVRFTLTKTEQESVSFYGTIEVLGEVRHVKVLRENSYRLGISFIKIDDSSKHKINDFVAMIEEKPQ